MKKPKPIVLVIVFLLVATRIEAQGIFNAVLSGNILKVKELVEKDPQLVKAKNARAATPLHVAASLDYDEIARYLIEKGADINARRGDSQTPLIVAGLKVTKLLIEKGADINYTTPDGMSAISQAVDNSDKEVFEYLLDRGARLPELGTYDADCSIELGLRMGSMKCLEKYSQQGLNPLFENNAKMTLVHFAAESNSTKLINRLIELGAPINKTDIYGWSPLHTAAYHGNQSVVELLIQKGLNKDARSIDGKTPYNLANEEKKTDVANYLLAHGADQSPPKLPSITGEYFGQKLPGKTPEPFVVGIPEIQKGIHGTFSFSPDGKAIYWKPVWSPNTPIYESKMVDGQWTAPKIAPFSAENQGDDVPFITPDGKKLLFLSQRPIVGGQLPFPYVEKIWVMDKTEEGWSTAKKLPEVVNSVEGMHWQISVDNRSNLYFGAGGLIYCAKYTHGKYTIPEKLGITINNTKDRSFSPFISQDGSYIIYSREVPHFTYQLFLSFKKTNGTWTEAINLSDYFKYKYSLNPRVTPDGKYFFFTGRWGVTYWVDASFIEELRPKK